MPDWSRQIHARLPLTEEEAEHERAEHKQPDVFDLMPWGTREAFWRSVVGLPAKEAVDG